MKKRNVEIKVRLNWSEANMLNKCVLQCFTNDQGSSSDALDYICGTPANNVHIVDKSIPTKGDEVDMDNCLAPTYGKPSEDIDCIRSDYYLIIKNNGMLLEKEK